MTSVTSPAKAASRDFSHTECDSRRAGRIGVTDGAFALPRRAVNGPDHLFLVERLEQDVVASGVQNLRPQPFVGIARRDDEQRRARPDGKCLPDPPPPTIRQLGIAQQHARAGVAGETDCLFAACRAVYRPTAWG